MPIPLIFLLLLALLAAGVSVYLVLGLVSVTLFVLEGHSLAGMLQIVVDHLNSGTLISVPFFVIAATFMQRGGIAEVLVNAANTWVGATPGGLALVCVFAAMVFSAISGSSVATALAMGTILVPAMLEKRYSRAFSLGVVGASGTLGILIPPSLALIVYGVVAEVSIPQLFLAGVIPGVMQVLLFVIYIVWHAKRKQFPTQPRLSRDEFLRVNLRALPALSIPLFVLGGIYSGAITITEAAALSALLSIVVSVVVYRQCRVGDIPNLMEEGIRNSAAIIIIVAFALTFGHWITESGIPKQLVAHLLASEISAWQFLLVMNGIMLMLGMFLEAITVILITLPIVLPLLGPLGISPIHYAIIVTINMELALLTPPIGLNLYILSGISKSPLIEAIRGITPFLLLLVLLLGLITFVPFFSVWLPGYIYG